MVAQTQNNKAMSNIRRYIGLSLSFCILDILQEKVAVDEISAIVTSTRFEDVYDAFDHYFINYWSMYADEKTCKSVLSVVWKKFVFQPRKNFIDNEHIGHMLSHGWWLDTFEGKVVKL